MSQIVRIEPDNLDAATDEDLAVTAQGGSVAAFEVLVRRYQVPVLRYLQRRIRSRADAEDVLQEVFVRAWGRLGQYRMGNRWKGWLFTIAHHCAVDHFRQPRLVSAGEAGEAAAAGEPELDERERRERLWAVARGLLSDEQYEALWLHYVEGLRTAEVARVLGRSWVAVKTQLVRARRRLAPHVAKLYDLGARGEAISATGEP